MQPIKVMKIMTRITTALEAQQTETPAEIEEALKLTFYIYTGKYKTETQLDRHLEKLERKETPISDALKTIENIPATEPTEFTKRDQPTPRPKERGEYSKGEHRLQKVQNLVIAKIALNNNEGVLLKTLEKELGYSNGTVWAGVKALIDSSNGEYEYYKDNTTKGKLRGIRLAKPQEEQK